MPLLLNPPCMLLGVRARCNALDVHSHKVCFSTSLFLFVNNHTSLIFLNIVLKDLKQATSIDWSVKEEKQCLSQIPWISSLLLASHANYVCLG